MGSQMSRQDPTSDQSVTSAVKMEDKETVVTATQTIRWSPACDRCTRHHLKCDRQTPCTNCSKLNATMRTQCSKKKKINVILKPLRGKVATKNSTDSDLILADAHGASSAALSPQRFANLCEYRKEFEWGDYRKYSKPMPYFHCIAYSLGNSVPNMPGLEFSRDYTDWIFPITEGTDLIIESRYCKPGMAIRDLQAYMSPEDHPRKYLIETPANAHKKEPERTKLFLERWHKDILKFVFQFEHTKDRWSHYYEAETTHTLIKSCAQFQGRIIEKAAANGGSLSHLDLLVLDALRALGLSHQISEVQMQMRESEFDEHGYIEPTTLAPGANGTIFKVTRYNYDNYCPYSESTDRPEGDKLGKILKHVILTCEENINNAHHWHVIAAVLSLLSLVLGDLSPKKDFIKTFDDEKLEEAWVELCEFLERKCGKHHPLWNYETCPTYFGQNDPKYKPYRWLFEDLTSIWNKGGLSKEYEDELLPSKLRALAFGLQ
ncbi:hypothetical protein DL98DRAFT_533854 [Cadophora sp. DSE1049]|nr:hypothetical protein DL98DRAFT_533854 [Cadophora sp. DSE1049]